MSRALGDPIVDDILHRSIEVVDYASWSGDSFFAVNIYSE